MGIFERMFQPNKPKEEQLEFLEKSGKIKKEVEEKSIAAAREREERGEINKFINIPELEKYQEAVDKKAPRLLCNGRAFIAAGLLRNKIENSGMPEEFVQKALEALPKQARKAYEMLEEVKEAQKEIEEVKPERKGLFARFKEKIGGWWQKRAQKKAEKAAIAEGAFLGPEFYLEEEPVYE